MAMPAGIFIVVRGIRAREAHDVRLWQVVQSILPPLFR